MRWNDLFGRQDRKPWRTLDEKVQRPMRFTGEVPWRGMVGFEGAVGTSKGNGGECDFLLGGGLRGILNWDFRGFPVR
jgi:hypothetical protein